jgi:hypothetical protein
VHRTPQRPFLGVLDIAPKLQQLLHKRMNTKNNKSGTKTNTKNNNIVRQSANNFRKINIVVVKEAMKGIIFPK